MFPTKLTGIGLVIREATQVMHQKRLENEIGTVVVFAPVFESLIMFLNEFRNPGRC